jgi:hypothetical protein
MSDKVLNLYSTMHLIAADIREIIGSSDSQPGLEVH